MTDSPVILEDVPFCIGVFDQPRNPDELPSTYPLGLWYDPQLSLVCQQQTPELDGLLQRSYRLGMEMGTPVSEFELGKGYAEDFLGFIASQGRPEGRALEVGAGVGYVSHCLKAAGWQVDSVEPGSGYEAHWKKYGVEVINDFFPTPRAVGPYNLIVSYAVLEHIADPVACLQQMAAHMTAGGKLVLAVPDCTEEVLTGDPGMLIHEHYFYFTEASLARCLAQAGFACRVERAGYGRLLYAVAWQDPSARVEVDAAEIQAGRAYAQHCADFVSSTRQLIRDAALAGSVGIFCPARALAVMPQDIDGLRFFDDSPSLQGRYYPPFPVAVESRDALLAEPVDELWIMSRTFGRKLKAVLEPQLPATRIRLLEDIEIR
ncbi:class I SAM-dependent methyltransferase [Azonexus sp.]|uniref:class I SAM-dependent methyltransferase n=1 Tax=Azonexus sp. TaxID=1872668 RepID=UPI0039E3DBCA